MKSTLVLFLICSFLHVNSQIRMNANTKHIISELKNIQNHHNGSVMNQSYPVTFIEGIPHLSFVGLVSDNFSVSHHPSVKIGSRIGNIVTLRIPVTELDAIEYFTGIQYLETAEKVKPFLDRALKDIRADSVHAGINLPMPFTGKDVMIGVTDWGFDYSHPMFYDTSLTNLRIHAAWDQYKQSGPAPAGYTYGTEYNTVSELLAAGSDTSNVYQYHYHGTHVAGIAGGSGAGLSYRGVAFESEFLFVTFLVDLAAVLDAFSWMKEKADAAGKRLVVNMSWGLYYMGNLDGTSLLSQAIDAYSEQGVVFVSSAGNNGDVNFHIKKDFNQDTLRTKIDFYPYNANASMWGQSITMWGTPNLPYTATIAVYNSSNQLMMHSPTYSTALLDHYVDTFLIAGADTIYYNLFAENANPFNQRPHMRLRIKNKNTQFKIALKSYADSGTVHYWNVTELTNGVGNWGMPFSVLVGSGWTGGNKEFGIGEPACANGVISVAAYTSEYYTTSGNLAGGQSANFSSIGPLMNGTMKPDISAPGVSVASSVSSYTNASYTLLQQTTFNNRTYPFARLSGTSMASPVVAGVAALMLQANPWLHPDDVKQILKQTAREDSKTGNIPDTGSTKWGWGKVHAYRAVWESLYFSGLNQQPSSVQMLYPNPASQYVMLSNLENLQAGYLINVYSMAGKQIMQLKNHQSSAIDVSTLPNGIYIIKVIAGNNALIYRMVISR